MRPRYLLAAVLIMSSAQVGALTLRWAAQNDVLTLDPHAQNHGVTNAMLQHVYEGLTRYDKDFKVEPCLATSWQQITPTHWRFHLRQGVRFHDGSPFTAADVLFSFRRIMQPRGTMQIYVAGVKEVRRVDDYTIDLILTGPNPVLLRNIVDFRIMSAVWADKTGSQNVQDYKAKEETFASRNTNGTGPYLIREWEPDTRLVFAANPAWWDRMDGNVTDVIYTPIKADAARVAALLAGEVDLVTDLPARDVPRLRTQPKLKVLDGHEVSTVFVGFDQHSNELLYSNVKGRNPFKDVRVRKALSIAVDREAIRRQTMRGLSIPAAIMVAPGVHGYSADLDETAAADIEGARSLLVEAGYPNGFEFSLECPINRHVSDEEICHALAGMWARVRLKVRLNPLPMATFILKIQQFDHSAYVLGWARRPSTRSTRCRHWCTPRPPAPMAASTWAHQRPRARRADRCDQDRDGRQEAGHDAARGAHRHARQVLLHDAAPPAASLGDEEERRHDPRANDRHEARYAHVD